MKKVYVKPVMESEAFVANEDGAACYYVKCDTWTGHSKIFGGLGCKGDEVIVKNPKLVDNSNSEELGFTGYQEGDWWFGSIDNKEPTWHHVEVREVTGNKSNAS